MSLSVLILAAGKGRRMNSAFPKVLQKLAGRPMIDHVLTTAKKLTGNVIVIVGSQQEMLREHLAGEQLEFVEQRQQLGTGHAVAQALPHLSEKGAVLILSGDVPLLTDEIVSQLIDCGSRCDVAVLTSNLDNPDGYGRIIRDKEGKITSIVEDVDADDSQRSIKEINTGIMVASAEFLQEVIPKIGARNGQNEYYLTDCIKIAFELNKKVGSVFLSDALLGLGVNDRKQLAATERALQARVVKKLMRDGVTVADPSRIDVRGELICGKDVFIDVNTVFSGRVVLGDRVTIGSNNVISDSEISSSATILSNCVVQNSFVGKGAQVGPFSHLRPESLIGDRGKIGNFVEIKKSDIGMMSKVNHLSYVGDTEVGERVNIGAGTITCNYDGENKHKTVIQDGVFIGSGSQLVAPVTIGTGSTVGAGSTITDNVNANSLAVSRVPQKSISDWMKRKKSINNK
jgi:bifunctional UDP-N-acetylglucosamine pyrophosphorylase/glucosamine-1-phosphate N-acetyltransferase